MKTPLFKLSLLAGLSFTAGTMLASASAEIYQQKCLMCHQATGLGIPNAFPPIAESEWVNGPAENLIRIQLRGLSGPITVKGKQYTSMMPAQADMSDENIASVLTYIRSNFGNKASAVTPEMVKKFRDEVGKPPLTVKDLIDPAKVETTEKTDKTEKPAEEEKK